MLPVGVTFAQPWVLLLILPTLLLFYVVGRERLRRFPPTLARLIMVLRLTIVGLVLLALAQPAVGRPSDLATVVFLVDGSDSIPPESRAAVERFVLEAQRLAGDRQKVAIVTFGRDAVVEKSLDGPPVGQLRWLVRGDATNVAEALHLARTLFPRVGARRIVLLSDGQETLGRAEEEARQAASAGIQISAVPLDLPTTMPEVLIEALEAPPQIREGDPLELRLVLQSTVDTEVQLRLWLDDRQVSEQTIPVRKGTTALTAPLSTLSRGFHRFWARIESRTDTFRQNNELGAFTVVKEKPRLLLVAPNEADVRDLREALQAAEMQVEVRPPSVIPPRLSAMKGYTAVILVNTPASSLTLDQMKTLQAYVRTLGGGLITIGGDQAYSLGEYQGTPLAEVLPVSMNIPGKRDRGSVAMLLVIDKSGSMDMREEGVTKMAMAREAANLAVEMLDENDQVGVLAFDSLTRWVVPIQRVGAAGGPRAIQDRINRIEASGGTEIYPALELGYRAIRGVNARFKHIVLLTDGRSLSAADYERLVQQMKQERITLSTIAIGSDADTELLQNLAHWGEGRYYYVDRARDIPKVTTRETRIASGSPVVEGTIPPQLVGTSAVLKGFAPAQLPPLRGYVVSSPREGAQILLASDRGDPLLAHWQYGLGRVVAWLSDAKSTGWASAWVSWPEFRRFWAQVVRWALPAPADPNIQPQVTVEGTMVTVRADVVEDDGSFKDLADLRVDVVGPGLREADRPLRQVAPGRYEWSTTVEQPGVYAVQVTLRERGREVRQELTGFVVGYPAEYRRFGVDQGLLGRLVAMTGGRLLTDPQAALAPEGLRAQGQEWAPLWGALLALALCLFPVEIALRRLPVPWDRLPHLLGQWWRLRGRHPQTETP
jgi:Mg-chelatase subunit ChlD/uncharacterized membrane protein